MTAYELVKMQSTCRSIPRETFLARTSRLCKHVSRTTAMSTRLANVYVTQQAETTVAGSSMESCFALLLNMYRWQHDRIT